MRGLRIVPVAPAIPGRTESAMATSQSRSLDSEKALVTGATSGIGRAIAVQLAREGADVIVHGRDAQRGEKVVQELRSARGKARFVAADLGNAAEVRRLAADAGALDILVNNAGLALFGPTAQFE